MYHELIHARRGFRGLLDERVGEHGLPRRRNRHQPRPRHWREREHPIDEHVRARRILEERNERTCNHEVRWEIIREHSLERRSRFRAGVNPDVKVRGITSLCEER